MTKPIKRIFAITSVLILVISVIALSGCSSSDSYQKQLKAATVQTPNIQKNGVLKVGVYADNPPLAGHSQSITGIDVDVAAAIADELGLTLEIVDVGSDSEGALMMNKCDIVMGVNKATKSDSYWKSEIYLQTAPVLFSTKANAAVPTKGDGKKYITKMSTSSADAVTSQMDTTCIRTVDNLNSAFDELNNGKVDFVAADAVFGTFYALRNGVDAYITALLAEPSGYCVELSSENTVLQSKINEAIQKLTSNGTVDVIERKWLARNLNLSSVPQTEGAKNQANIGDLDSAVYAEVKGTAVQN